MKNDKKISSCTIVIRSVGERTTVLCAEILESQVDQRNIFIINETPFSKAVVRTYEIGIENNLPWTIAIDADVLVRKNGIRDLVSAAENHPHDFFKGNAKVVDKFLGGERNICPHIYKTKYLSKGLDLFPTMNSLRPESTAMDSVNHLLGVEPAPFGITIGIHDYEQLYSDIYRKAFVFAFKHRERLKKYIYYWSKYINQDLDFLVAITGLYKGIFSKTEEIEIDYLTLPTDYRKNKILEDIEEKKKLEKLPFNFISSTIFKQKILSINKKIGKLNL